MKSNKSKKIFSWNCIFDSFEVFPSSKIDIWSFLKWPKMEFSQYKISWNWFIWFREFFSAWTFLNFLAYYYLQEEVKNFVKLNFTRFFFEKVSPHFFLIRLLHLLIVIESWSSMSLLKRCQRMIVLKFLINWSVQNEFAKFFCGSL